MKILIINAYPGKEGLTKFLSQEYEKSLDKSKHSIKRIDLYNLKFDLILHEGYKGNQALEKDLKKSQELILWAEHIVWFYPIWWTDVPALLKGFIDRIFLPGFAFKYEKSKLIKLLNKKTSEIFATGGGPNWIYKTFGKIAQLKVMGSTLNFCGIKINWFKIKVFGNIIPYSDKKYVQKIINSVKKRARNK